MAAMAGALLRAGRASALRAPRAPLSAAPPLLGKGKGRGEPLGAQRGAGRRGEDVRRCRL